MVNYQGPKMLRGAFEMAKVPIFNRVDRIAYPFRDLSNIQLEKADVTRLQRMKELSIVSRGAIEIADVEAAGSIVPPCRLVSLAASKDQIEVEMSPGSAFACSVR